MMSQVATSKLPVGTPDAFAGKVPRSQSLPADRNFRPTYYVHKIADNSIVR